MVQSVGVDNKHHGSTLQSLFEELGELEEVRAMAAKRVLAMDVERRMKKLGLTTTTLAERMGTSRSQVHRILNEDDTGVTLRVLLRLADVLGMKLQIGLEPSASRGRSRAA
jgi:antitoxin HicB